MSIYLDSSRDTLLNGVIAADISWTRRKFDERKKTWPIVRPMALHARVPTGGQPIGRSALWGLEM
jgi:hypothetical protein